MNDKLKDYFEDLRTKTSITMSNEQMNNRESAFTQYVLSQIATKVAAENFQVTHADIKDTAGKYLG